MKWMALIAVALACVVVLWVFVTPPATDRATLPSTGAAPKQFDTEGGQEMRPQWNR